jgi:hypothetical protein
VRAMLGSHAGNKDARNHRDHTVFVDGSGLIS